MKNYVAPFKNIKQPLTPVCFFLNTFICFITVILNVIIDAINTCNIQLFPFLQKSQLSLNLLSVFFLCKKGV